MRKTLIAAAVLLLLVAPLLVAQSRDTGAIRGKITDEQGAPLPGVAVSLTSPNLMGTRSFLSDANGDFRFPALPPGGKYELVLHNAEHSAFTDRALPGDTEKQNPNHHRIIVAISTAFWDAWLREDTAARKWLDGDGPTSVLEPNDRWQKK